MSTRVVAYVEKEIVMIKGSLRELFRWSEMFVQIDLEDKIVSQVLPN